MSGIMNNRRGLKLMSDAEKAVIMDVRRKMDDHDPDSQTADNMGQMPAFFEDVGDDPVLEIDRGQQGDRQQVPPTPLMPNAIPRKTTWWDQLALGASGAERAVNEEANTEERRRMAEEMNRMGAAGKKWGSLIGSVTMNPGKYTEQRQGYTNAAGVRVPDKVQPDLIELEGITEADHAETKPMLELEEASDPNVRMQALRDWRNPPKPEEYNIGVNQRRIRVNPRTGLPEEIVPAAPNASGEGGPKNALAVTWAEDPVTGELVAYQTSSAGGRMTRATTQDGHRLLDPLISVDTGVGTSLRGRNSGAERVNVQKDIAGAESLKVEGKVAGERLMAKPEVRAGMRASLGKLENLGKEVDAVANSPDLPRISGKMAYFKNMYGSNAANLEAKMLLIEANNAFQELSDMRAASPSGGALGTITEKELELLKAARAALQRSQGAPQLRENLLKLREQMKTSASNILQAYRETYKEDYETGLPVPITKADFDALPSKTKYVDPDDGLEYEKP